MLGWIVRIVAVIALLGGAAALATPRGRLPLALRGLQSLLRKDRGLQETESPAPVSAWRRVAALLLVLLAVLLTAL